MRPQVLKLVCFCVALINDLSLKVYFVSSVSLTKSMSLCETVKIAP